MSLASQDEFRVSVACEQPALGADEKMIFNSWDGAHTFTRARQAPPFIGDGSNLARPSPGHLALACVSTRVTANLIYSSSDGGRTWRTALNVIDGGKGWFDFGFATALRGAAVEGTPAVGSHLYLTTDGGASWHRARF
jgi:hypothetical protein